MSAKISWCAMVVCWAYQVQNAFKKLELEFNSLEKEKINYFEIFKSIADGEINID